MRLRDFFLLLRGAASDWSEDNALRLSAALAYYSLFSMAPLLMIVISIAGLFFGQAAARGQIGEQMRQLAGDRTAEALQALLEGTSQRLTSLSATFIGLALLLFGASGVFSELKDALNTIWGVAIKPGSPLRTLVRERFISFTMVVGVGFLLLISLIVSAALAALAKYMRSFLAGPAYLWQTADFVVSAAITTLLFAMIFKVLPNVEIRWRDVWIGAGVTAFLFTIGKFLIGFYLGTSGVASYYGAAGSAFVLLLWVYYSACILFFGAEFTKSYVRKYGHGILPDRNAIFRAGRGPGARKAASLSK
jgi:membrane protein